MGAQRLVLVVLELGMGMEDYVQNDVGRGGITYSEHTCACAWGVGRYDEASNASRAVAVAVAVAVVTAVRATST